MKKLLLIFLVCICLASSLQAQSYFSYENDRYFEIGGSIGMMNYRGDLNRRIQWRNSQTAASFFVAYNFKNVLVGRAEYTMGNVIANDLDGNDKELAPRGFNFRSKISEAAFIAEFHPLNMNYFTDMYGAPVLSPYIAGGVGMFWFNPKAEYDGVTYELAKYRLEGQGFPETGRKPYSLQQMSYPLGFGLKYDLTAGITLRGEFLYRFTSTDYMDDVSTVYIDPALFDKYLPPADAAIAKNIYKRIVDIPGVRHTTTGEIRGFSHDKDGFFTLSFRLSFNLGRVYGGEGIFSGGARCPVILR